jgi:hypothetical protein
MIVRDQFVVDISYDDKAYTPKQALKYIAKTSTEGFADPKELAALKKQSLAKACALIQEHKLDINKPIKKSSSQCASDLADLVLQHCDSTMDLIIDGGSSRGYLI